MERMSGRKNEKAKTKLQNKEEKTSERDRFISGRWKEEKEQKNEEAKEQHKKKENMHKTKAKK
jgi:hypothetical protein